MGASAVRRVTRLRPGTRREFYNPGMSVFALGINHTTAPLDLRELAPPSANGP